MSTISFAQSAVFPGSTPASQWSQYWTPWATQYVWSTSGGAQLDTIGRSVQIDGSSPGTASFDMIKFGGSVLSGSAPLVVVSTSAEGGATQQAIRLNAVWNTIKDIELTQLDTDATTVAGFVDTLIDDGGDTGDRSLEVDGAKRGEVVLGDGNDALTVNFASNENSWSNTFIIAAGNGNDTITLQPESWADLAAMPTPSGWVFNSAPQATFAQIAVGNGNDTLNLDASASVSLGDGTDTVNLLDGLHSVTLGGGSDAVNIAAHGAGTAATRAVSTARDVNRVTFGSGHASVAVDDSAGSQTPLTTLSIGRGETGGSTDATADVIRYGHVDAASGAFVGGNWSALTFELTGYAAGSTAALTRVGGHADLAITDAATGSVDMLALYGAVPSSLSGLHVVFSHPAN